MSTPSVLQFKLNSSCRSQYLAFSVMIFHHGAKNMADETQMNAENMRSLNPGDILVYDDGRPGHTGVKAVVLSNHPNCVLVHFEDRADTTTIKHNDAGWTKYLKRN